MSDSLARLPAAAWTAREDLAGLVAAIGADDLRWVGGAVRDTLIGAPVRDVDAATPLLPNEVAARLKRAGIGTVPTGIEHGTLTAILPGGNVEITTLRKDVATDGRRATIAFASDWREDAARRDFTINALYAHPETHAISDFFGGAEDLAAGRVRFIGDAGQRIREDHLRILRYFRFQTRFGSELDPEAERACAELAPMLKGLSRERVGWELQTLLALPDPGATIARMKRLGVLGVVLPEAGAEQIAALERLIAAEHDAGIAPDPVRRLAALLPRDARLAQKIAARLRLSNAQARRLVAAAGRPPEGDAVGDGDARALAYRMGRELALDRLLLSGADPSPIEGWDIPVLPLKGGEIVERGVEAGPEVARLLRAVEDRWIAERFPGRERVLTLLKECLTR